MQYHGIPATLHFLPNSVDKYMESVKLTAVVTFTYDTDIGGDHEGEADGQTEGDGAAHHVQLRGEQTPPTHRALPAPTRHQYPLINKILYLDGQSGSSSQ